VCVCVCVCVYVCVCLTVCCVFLVSQQKLKEEREAKRAQLDGRHDYVLSIVASCLGLDKPDVEDAILEGTQVLSGLLSCV